MLYISSVCLFMDFTGLFELWNLLIWIKAWWKSEFSNCNLTEGHFSDSLCGTKEEAELFILLSSPPLTALLSDFTITTLTVCSCGMCCTDAMSAEMEEQKTSHYSNLRALTKVNAPPPALLSHQTSRNLTNSCFFSNSLIMSTSETGETMYS